MKDTSSCTSSPLGERELINPIICSSVDAFPRLPNVFRSFKIFAVSKRRLAILLFLSLLLAFSPPPQQWPSPLVISTSASWLFIFGTVLVPLWPWPLLTSHLHKAPPLPLVPPGFPKSQQKLFPAPSSAPAPPAGHHWGLLGLWLPRSPTANGCNFQVPNGTESSDCDGSSFHVPRRARECVFLLLNVIKSYKATWMGTLMTQWLTEFWGKRLLSF